MKNKTSENKLLSIEFNQNFIHAFEQACVKLGVEDKEIIRKAMVKAISLTREINA